MRRSSPRQLRPVIAILAFLFLAPGALYAGDRGSATPYYQQGNQLYDSDHFADAVSQYDSAIAQDPKFVEAFYNRALAEEMVDRSKALEDWQKFLDISDNDPTYKWDVARIKARIQVLQTLPALPDSMQVSYYVPDAGDYYRWISQASEGDQWRDFPVKVYLGSAPNIKWQQGTREAFDIWKSVFPLELAALPEDADIRLGWQESVEGEGRAGEESDWVRYQRVGGETSGRRVAIITVDLSRPWSKDEMRAIMLHEFGHALGIKGHSPNKGDIMYWQMQEKFHPLPAPTIPLPVFWKSLVKQPSQADINTLIRLYNSPGSVSRFP